MEEDEEHNPGHSDPNAMGEDTDDEGPFKVASSIRKKRNKIICVTTHASKLYDTRGRQDMMRVPEGAKIIMVYMAPKNGVCLQKREFIRGVPINYGITIRPLENIAKEIKTNAISLREVLQCIADSAHNLAITSDTTALNQKVGLIGNSLKDYTSRVLAPGVKKLNKLRGTNLTTAELSRLQRIGDLDKETATNAREDIHWLANLDGIGEVVVYEAGERLPKYHFACELEEITDINNRVIDMETGEYIRQADPTHTTLSEIVQPNETTVIFNFGCDDMQYNTDKEMTSRTARYIYKNQSSYSPDLSPDTYYDDSSMLEGDAVRQEGYAVGKEGEINLFVAVLTHGTTEFNLDGKPKMFRIPERTNLSYINLSARCGLSLQKAANINAPKIVYGQPPRGETIDNIISNIANVSITTHDVLQEIAYLSIILEHADETTFEHYKYLLAEALKTYSDRVIGGWVKTAKLGPLSKVMTGDMRVKTPLAALRADSRQLHSHGVTERDIRFAQWHAEATEDDTQIGTLVQASPGTNFPDYLYSYNPTTEPVTEDKNIIVITNTGVNIDDMVPLRRRPLSYVLSKLEEKYPDLIINVCVISFACSTTKLDDHSVSESEERRLRRGSKMDIGGGTRKRRKRYTLRKNTRKNRNITNRKQTKKRIRLTRKK